jgi:2-dehydropantoate 2-reductase
LHVLILGAGAVGLGLAAKLSEVADVTAITREGPAGIISEQGLTLDGAWGNKTYHFPCCASPPVGGKFDYILITTKAYSTEDLCRSYAGLLSNTNVVSLQNGLGSEEIISGFTSHVIGCVVMTGFIRQGEQRVHVSADAGETLFGRFPAGLDNAVTELTEIFREAGIPARGVPDIKCNLWSKNLISCTLNPISAVLGVTYGMLTREPGWQIISEITREVFQVASAEGVGLLWDGPEEYLAYLKKELIPVMATHTSSMLQDIISGRRTEVGFINGAITRFGQKHGIATPYNECLTNLVQFREIAHIDSRF